MFYELFFCSEDKMGFKKKLINAHLFIFSAVCFLFYEKEKIG
jgi:hypothetical protein